MKSLSVLGSKLLNQVLQRRKLSPVDKVELLQKQNISFSIGYLGLYKFLLPIHSLTGVVVVDKKKGQKLQ